MQLAACVLRGGGTMMMGFACALTAAGASHRVLKLTQLLLQLTVVVARAVPLVAAPPLVSLPQIPAMPLPAGGAFHAHPSIHPRTLTATSVVSGVSYVGLWLKHALSCLRPGMLHSHTPDSICSAWQPLLAQAVLAGLPNPPAGCGGSTGSQPFVAAGNAPMDTSPAAASQPAVLASSASPFLGLPAAAGPLSAHQGVVTWGGLGAGMRFGSALRTDVPFAAQLSPHMSSAAVFADQQATAATPEVFNMSDTLASAPCRALKKAVRAVVASLAAPPPPATPLSDGLSSFPFAPFSNGPLATAAPAAPQHVFQPALCLTGNAFTAQHAYPAMPLNAGSPVLLPHVLTPAPVHLPLNSHVMHPVAVANSAAPPMSAPPFFAASAAPAAYFSPQYSMSTGASPGMPVLSAALGVAHEPLGMVAGAVSHAPGIAHMQAHALGLSPQVAASSGGHGMHAAPLAMHAMPMAGMSMGSAGVNEVRLPVMGSLEQGMEAVMLGTHGTPAPRLNVGMPGKVAEEHGRSM